MSGGYTQAGNVAAAAREEGTCRYGLQIWGCLHSISGRVTGDLVAFRSAGHLTENCHGEGSGLAENIHEHSGTWFNNYPSNYNAKLLLHHLSPFLLAHSGTSQTALLFLPLLC